MAEPSARGDANAARPRTLPTTIPYYLADQIRHGIVRGRYPPGASLREQDLGEEFGSSRGPVRESLRLLELQGLVVHSPRRGFRVKEYADADIDSLYRLRALLEAAVIDALAGRDTAALVARMHDINELMKHHVDRAHIDGYFEENINFHQAMIDYTENTTLIHFLSIMNDMSLPLRYLLLREHFPENNDYAYHKRIIDSLAARDLEEAKRLTQAHILENLPKVKACYARFRPFVG